ncbi:MAG: Glu/Leu/Phe/Val dehydrogenase [Candidatus Lambdaproteobacteria bacterium]|nr:Glu/Leu/Phe/Val dehydrogenase [Candidatus Lambdaproteobacteria bacterium]
MIANTLGSEQCEPDGIGPEMVVYLYEPPMRGMVVVDNTRRGPALGGTRMAPDVSTREVLRLARTMTLKNAVAELPFGGGKSAILFDRLVAGPEATRRVVEAFARRIRDLPAYIPGPDLGTNEADMRIIYGITGRVGGIPDGLPIDALGVTGFGVCVAARTAAARMAMPLQGARVAIQGFGNVGSAVARYFQRDGARLVAVADVFGDVYAPEGLDVAELLELFRRKRPMIEARCGRRLPRGGVLEVPCDVLVPAARPDAIHEGNVGALKARLIVQGANIPATAAAEGLLHRRGIVNVPDIIANAGGVIGVACEAAHRTTEEMFQAVESTIARRTDELLERVAREQVTPREAATRMALERLFA